MGAAPLLGGAGGGFRWLTMNNKTCERVSWIACLWIVLGVRHVAIAAERPEHFDKDPGWDGHNNRAAPNSAKLPSILWPENAVSVLPRLRHFARWRVADTSAVTIQWKIILTTDKHGWTRIHRKWMGGLLDVWIIGSVAFFSNPSIQLSINPLFIRVHPWFLTASLRLRCHRGRPDGAPCQMV